MILVDSRVGSKELLPAIRALKVEAELGELEAGDFCFYGNNADGQVLIGIERKRLGSSSDLMDSIHSGRFSGLQQHNMIAMYKVRILIVEGVWKPSEEGNLLVMDWQGWRTINVKGKPVPYSAVLRWLLSVTFQGGTHVMRTGSPHETAQCVVDCYHWFSKEWDQHHSQGVVQKMPIPQFSPPSFEQCVAAQIPGIGTVRSLAAAKHFKTMAAMGRATELEWMGVDGIGPRTARKIAKLIHGEENDCIENVKTLYDVRTTEKL